MEKIKIVSSEKDALAFLTVALKHEWAVSFEYVIHAYSMPKNKYFYTDPILKQRTDVRSQTIQIGIDEMYHALQLGMVIRQMGGDPTFSTDEVIRHPRLIDNLRRDMMTENEVTELYQSVSFERYAAPKIQNMVLNISGDEVRHGRQFERMIDAMIHEGHEGALCARPDPAAEKTSEVQKIHRIMNLENGLMHAYLRYVLIFGEHQDLSQRLFKNSINHMRHWDKNSGLLIRLGSVLRIENAETDASGRERSASPMPAFYSGRDRRSALEQLLPAEETLIAEYEKLIPMFPDGEIKDQLHLQLALKREHLFTQEWLLANARKIPGLI